MTSSGKKREAKNEYENFKSIILAELDRIINQDDCDIHRAFVHETSRVFSSTASGFSLTDGKNEWGIDFCRMDPPIFTIVQCKCPEWANLEGSGKPKQYNRDALEDLLTGIKFVRDTRNTYQTTLDLKQFKNSYHESMREWKKETKLQAALAILGDLSPQADNYFKNLRNSFQSEGIELLLWDWKKYDELLTTPQIDIENMKLTFEIEDPSKEIIRRSTPVCFVRGMDLVKAWDNYQWNLVDWNVRAEIKNSPTNKRIQDTLSAPSGRKHFQDYNNGLLVVCKQVTYKDLPKNKLSVTLKQPQVVNGCQTLLSLVRAYLDLSERDKEDFAKNVSVQLKIIQNQPIDFVEKIVQSTNDQNPMSARSLKSNTIEQKKLQESFSKCYVKYFYERKDGQFEGLLNFGQRTPSFRPGDYLMTSGKKKYRLLDNEELAHEWLSFIGYSDEMLRGGIKLFDNDDLYRKAFLAHPSKEYWTKLIKSPSIAPPVQNDRLFEDGSPGVSQFLLAHVTSSIIKQRRVSFHRNRTAAIERLVKRGIIASDTSLSSDDMLVIERYLSKDEKYYLGTVINNMNDVLIELFAMILCLRYGALEETKCHEILRYPPIRQHVDNPFAAIPKDADTSEAKHVLNLIYEFLLFALGQYVVRYGDVIRAQPRLKSYLAQRNTINRLREFVLEIDEEKIPGLCELWCPERKSFIKQLPDLS